MRSCSKLLVGVRALDPAPGSKNLPKTNDFRVFWFKGFSGELLIELQTPVASGELPSRTFRPYFIHEGNGLATNIRSGAAATLRRTTFVRFGD